MQYLGKESGEQMLSSSEKLMSFPNKKIARHGHFAGTNVNLGEIIISLNSLSYFYDGKS